MKINILSDSSSWLNAYIPSLQSQLAPYGTVTHAHSASALKPADVTFILSFFELLPVEALKVSRHNLVVHESDLPEGRGWSPMTWQVLAGQSDIPVVLFEATELADRGQIYLRTQIKLNGSELVGELRAAQAKATIDLCLKFVDEFPDIVSQGVAQNGKGSTYRRRSPDDSRLDPDKSIRDQFNLLRVADNEHYPAFFELAGQKYVLKIEKAGARQ